jgi:hypothetical protein
MSCSYTVVFLGDFVDRGKRSKEVMDWLVELKQSVYVCGCCSDSVVVVRGNNAQGRPCVAKCGCVCMSSAARVGRFEIEGKSELPRGRCVASC